jgi:hypothetical protein
MRVAWLTAVASVALGVGPSANAQAVEPVVPVRQQAENIGAIESQSTETALTRSHTRVRSVTFHGHFIDTRAPVPKGARAPSGTNLTYRINAKGQVLEEELGGTEASHWPASAKAASRRRAKAHAAAAWPCYLGGGETHHCYAISEWYMGPGEHVEGGDVIVDTEQVNAYEWTNGAFVTNEMWLTWNSGPWQWVEVGQIAGSYLDCCSIHPFVAWKIAGQPFTKIRNEGLIYNTNQYYQYQISGQSADGHWCLYIGGSQVACPYFGPAYASGTVLQDGMEVGANTWQANNGVNQVTGWWSGARHHWLFDALFRQTDTCVLRPSGAPWPGDVQYATCQAP